MTRNPFRLALVLALALTVATGGQVAEAAPSPPIDIGSLTPAKAARLSDDQLRSLVDEASFVAGAVATTDLTNAEARRIYDEAPEMILSVPAVVTDEQDTSGTLASGCTVRTRKKVRNSVGLVMYSFTLWKTWFYDGKVVTSTSHRHAHDITAWGIAWHWNGIVDEQYWWLNWRGRAHGGHHGERIGQFKTFDGPVAFTHNVKRAVTGYADGSWRTTSASDADC